MKLQQLRYLVAVVQAGSITEAARRLNVSQPALSAGLNALEAELGGPLLERQRGHARLTPLGARFYRRAKNITNECEVAKVEFRRGLARSFITVGVLPTISMSFVLDFVRGFTARMPDVEVSVREADEQTLLSMLARGRIDAALTISDRVEGGEWVPLFHDPLALVCAPEHRFARAASVRVADLDAEPFILRQHCERGAEANDIFDARGVRLRVVLKTNQDYRALEAVKARLGVTIAPRSLVTDVIAVPIEDLGLTRTVGIHLATTLETSICDPLVEALKDRARPWARLAAHGGEAAAMAGPAV